MDEMMKIKSSHDQFNIHSSKLDTLQQDIARLVRNQEQGNTALSANLASLITKLVTLSEDRALWDRQFQIIKSLYFPELKRRESDIIAAHIKTEKWLYVRNRTTFPEWLENGKGIYWIQGLVCQLLKIDMPGGHGDESANQSTLFLGGDHISQAGSGKPTLMKFICHNPQTFACLNFWAGNSVVNTANFFFWNQGHTMQKSLHGLVQSLLYQILRKMPGLIPEICGAHAEYEAWEFAALKEMIRRLLKRTSLSTKFCFFIDGLDEYNGDVQDVVEVLQSLVKPRHIKICASSRPWPAFEDAFANTDNTLAVQDFTKEDMKLFVRDTIAVNSNLQRLASRDPSYEKIIIEIAARARGVWLWVFLVSRDLKRALDSEEEYTTLENILNGFPPDLSTYFEVILQRVGPVYRKEMARIFLLTMGAVSPLPLYAFDFFGTKWYSPVDDATRSQAVATYRKWKRRLHNRCGDLLTVRKYGEGNPLFLYRVDFLHRTVRDWLSNKISDLQHELGSEKELGYWMLLYGMVLHLLKAFPMPELGWKASTGVIGPLVEELLHYAYKHEQQLPESANSDHHSELFQLLDRVDWLLGNYCHTSQQKSHWTNALRPFPRMLMTHPLYGRERQVQLSRGCGRGPTAGLRPVQAEQGPDVHCQGRQAIVGLRAAPGTNKNGFGYFCGAGVRGAKTFGNKGGRWNGRAAPAEGGPSRERLEHDVEQPTVWEIFLESRVWLMGRYNLRNQITDNLKSNWL